jgi:hypothetical protein
LGGREYATRCRNLFHQHTRAHRNAGRLRSNDVSHSVADERISRAGMDFDGDKVAHGPAWKPKCGFLPKKLGDARLQPVDGGVFTPLLVTHLSIRNRSPHRVRGFRFSVTDK